jgi:cell division protein FtsL
MVLDRFYKLGPLLWEAIDADGSASYVSLETVLAYFDRVIRASTQKARAWSEIAKRYQNLNEPSLARSVAGRAYASAYLESILMSRVMLRVVDQSLPEDKAQVRQAVQDAQRIYRSSLLEMQDIYSEIEDGLLYFGFQPDYVPIPALDSEDFRQSNAFEIILLRSRNKLSFAREREDTALNTSREFERDQAQFSSELAQIRNNYEAQLGDICGTFEANGRVYPGLRKYAYLDEGLSALGDPCGLVGNGQLHAAVGELRDLNLESQSLRLQVSNLLAEVQIEKDRVAAQCDELLEEADYVYEVQGEINTLESEIRSAQFTINRIQGAQQTLTSALSSPNAVLGVANLLAGGGAEAGVSLLEKKINKKQSQIADLERARAYWQTANQCDLAQVESDARVKTLLLRMGELELSMLRVEHRTRLGLAEIQRLRNTAKRVELEQAETEQLSVNVQAAHNNPNVRIYKNDAIINAEIAFDDAIIEIYKLTRVFEYYTSQSYEHKEDLFQIRTVARGSKNLENYLNALENAFYDFEALFGVPARRVHVVSLKNDILAIPYTDEAGQALSESERTEMMRARLTDNTQLDSDGYLRLGFSTSLDQLSPLTRNHKLLYVESDIYGSDTGDYLGRIYLNMKGTGVINSVEDELQYHRFEERLMVLNPQFSHVAFFDASVYRSYQLRDRPLVNTEWELILNQRDEVVNQDINLGSLTDIRLYLYYTDFTPN